MAIAQLICIMINNQVNLQYPAQPKPFLPQPINTNIKKNDIRILNSNIKQS